MPEDHSRSLCQKVNGTAVGQSDVGQSVSQ